MAERRLTTKQRHFVEHYAANGGNALDAARKAGYKQPQVQSAENMENHRIQSAIKVLTQDEEDTLVAKAIERQTFWTEMMRDSTVHPRDRLKASELLGKAQGDFLTKVEVTDVTPAAPVVIQLGGHTLDLVALGWVKLKDA